MAEEKTEKEENTKENPDWHDTLMADGVKSAESGAYIYDIDLREYKGDKVKLILAQAQRAKDIIKQVVEKEFNNIQYEVYDYDAIWRRELYIYAHNGLRNTYMFFMDNDGVEELHVLKDEVLQKRAREALTFLVIGKD
jgi:ribosomal protein L31E